MKKLIMGLALIFLNGCAAQLARVPADQLSGLSADQIKALKDAGQKVRACLEVGGPPIAGAGTILILPGDDTQTYVFGPDCHLKQ